MGLNVAHRTFTVLATDTVGTTGTVNLPASFDLKVVLFLAVARTGTGTSNHARLSHGAASSTTARFACGADSPDGVANGDGFSVVRNDGIIAFCEGTTLLGGRIDLNAFGATSFQWIVDDQLAESAEILCLCLGGSDITSAAVGTAQAPAVAGNWDGPNLGFDPTPIAAGRTALILMGASFLDVTINNPEPAAAFSLGFATSASEQAVVAVARRNSPVPGAGHFQSTSYCFASNLDGWGGLHTTHAFNSWQPTTFRLTKAGDGDMTYQGHLGYVVIKGPRFKVHQFALQTSIGTFAETDPAFPTTALLCASTNRVTAGSLTAFTADWEFAAGMAADPGTVEQGAVWTIDPDLATTDTAQRLDKTRTFLNYSRTGANIFALESDGTFVGDQALGYDLNQTDADASAYLWHALAIGAVSSDPAETQLTDDAYLPMAAPAPGPVLLVYQ